MLEDDEAPEEPAPSPPDPNHEPEWEAAVEEATVDLRSPPNPDNEPDW